MSFQIPVYPYLSEKPFHSPYSRSVLLPFERGRQFRRKFFGRIFPRKRSASEYVFRSLSVYRGKVRSVYVYSSYPGCDFGPLTLSLENVPDEDWETSWMRSYRPLPVGERFLVVPQWMTVADMQGRLPVILDLGLTFGTGEHASTQMCMQTLETIVHGGERVADLGSGSGILSICALRLGAASAVGVDVDPAAEHIARENAARNGFGPDRFSACTGNVVTDSELMARLREGGGFDIVCANIVAGVIVQLVPVIPQLLKTGGRFLCSGILAERETEVRQAIEAAGLHVIADRHTDEWCCLLAQ